MKTSSQLNRAPFSEDLIPLRNTLAQLLPSLEEKPDWYGSIYFERKSLQSCSALLKQTQMSDQVTLGAVFRIYDGFTLYEEATDDLDPQHLKTFVRTFVSRVLQQEPPPAGAIKRIYTPPTWQQRLSRTLDPEITNQVPTQNLDIKTPVHFGIHFDQDPTLLNPEACLQKLSDILRRCQALAAPDGAVPQELGYLAARQSLSKEESIFIDRETNMSQTLYRIALGITTMSGGDRTFIRLGGLGGLEAIEVADSELLKLLQDLKSLKSADRIQPGKYRVLFGPVLSGVLAHEAFGHSQEGDTCARGRSKAWDLHHSGEKVGNEHATILNNPAVFENAGKSYAAWGSYFFDEEGWLAQEQILLDKGKLLAPMTHLTSSIQLGVPRTANGKRENWTHGVYTRQTNTYFSPGDKTFDELMKQLGDGFLAIHPAGGMEDPKGMGIQVGISYLQEVKDGKLTGKVLKGPAGGDIQMTGYTPDVLNSILAKSKIDAHSNLPDQAKHPYNDAGGCGKYHKEFVFAGCGGPYLLLDQIILG